MTEDAPISPESYDQPPLPEEDPIYSNPDSTHTEELIGKTTIENFFDTEGIIQRLEKSMRGYQIRDGEYVKVGDELAQDSFIDKTINSLRSVINPYSMISKMSEDDIKDLLMEKMDDFIESALDEPSVGEDDITHIIDLVDHSLQIFMGHLREGHGSKILRQLGGNLYVPDKEQENKSYTLGSMFSFGGKKG